MYAAVTPVLIDKWRPPTADAVCVGGRVYLKQILQAFPLSPLLFPCFYFFALLFTSHRSPLSERLEQAITFSKLLSEPACRFTLSQSSPPGRNATYLRTFFFRIYLCLSKDFVNRHVFLLLYLPAQNSHEECNEFEDLLFWRLSLCLSRDSLSCDTRSY